MNKKCRTFMSCATQTGITDDKTEHLVQYSSIKTLNIVKKSEKTIDKILLFW